MTFPSKTCFIRSFNLFKALATLLILSTSITLLLTFIQTQIQNNHWLITACLQMNRLNLFLFSLLLVLILIEVLSRSKNDHFVNSLRSFWATLQLRQFLILHVPLSKRDSAHSSQKKDIVLTSFNRSVRKSVLDLRETQLLLILKIPKEAQSQALLKSQQDAIREHLSSLYPNYILSPFERHKFNLWLVGTKEKE